MHKRTKACDIPQNVKQIVWERDREQCIICGSNKAMPNAHYIARSHGGLGIPENIVTLCMNCHYQYDHTSNRKEYRALIKNYLKSKYSEWDENKLIYKKWSDKNDD